MLVAAAVALVACGRTKDGDLTVERPGDVDVDVSTTKDTIKLPEVGTRIDTINTPTMGTKPETLIVQKPVVGTKKTEVKVPVIKKP
jgi:microcompartment protein CcmL/EutN